LFSASAVSSDVCVTRPNYLSTSIVSVCTHRPPYVLFGHAGISAQMWGGVATPSTGLLGYKNVARWLERSDTTDGPAATFVWHKKFDEEGDVVVDHSYRPLPETARHVGVPAHFITPVASTAPALLPVPQDGLPASTPGNGGFAAQPASGRYVTGETVILSAGMSWPFTATLELDGVEIASGLIGYWNGSGYYASYELPNHDDTDTGSYVFKSGAAVSDSAEVLVLAQVIAATDEIVDVAGTGDVDAWQWSGLMQHLADGHAVAAARMVDAEAADPDSEETGFYGWDGVGPAVFRWTYKGDWLAEHGFGFDPDLFYTYTGAEMPFTGYPPRLDAADWTVIGDPGYDYREEVLGWGKVIGFGRSVPPGYSAETSMPFTIAGRAVVGGVYYCWKGVVNAAFSATGSPRPHRVEIQLITREDGVIVDTGAWIDITGSNHEVAPPDAGAWTSSKVITCGCRITYIDPITCHPVSSPVFVCWPGITACS
jgi:hypothetical protein